MSQMPKPQIPPARVSQCGSELFSDADVLVYGGLESDSLPPGEKVTTYGVTLCRGNSVEGASIPAMWVSRSCVCELGGGRAWGVAYPLVR